MIVIQQSIVIIFEMLTRRRFVVHILDRHIEPTCVNVFFFGMQTLSYQSTNVIVVKLVLES